ncbi:MAG TPA: nickel pincer cofactor biosynthesis protein LarB [Polyangiaceae bacterium]|nr:nickel pincer cofactor biosynthesis protein LarB [Polyangiaceae bacterium]
MNPSQLQELLQRVQRGELAVNDAQRALEHLPFSELEYAKVDHHRALRLGLPEVIFGEGKRAEQIVGIAQRLVAHQQNVLVTRVAPALAEAVLNSFPELKYAELARTLSYEASPITPFACEPVAIVTAGTSDLPVAEEALETLRMCGVPASRVFDVGVAGIHRLFSRLETLTRAPVVIVVAGMEGALPSVVGGLVGAPIIAVPTSVGYGTALSGFTALFGMLTSCASGLTVVNIDNGFGAAVAALRMVRHGLGRTSAGPTP